MAHDPQVAARISSIADDRGRIKSSHFKMIGIFFFLLDRITNLFALQRVFFPYKRLGHFCPTGKIGRSSSRNLKRKHAIPPSYITQLIRF